jgi:transposase InsO family protein
MSQRDRDSKRVRKASQSAERRGQRGETRAERGYKRHPGFKGGMVSHVAPNVLDRQFEVDEPNKAWVTDFTYGAPNLGRRLEDAAWA